MMNMAMVVDGPTLTLVVGFTGIFALMFIQGQRIDSTNSRIDKCIEDNKNVHKEIMELIKKL